MANFLQNVRTYQRSSLALLVNSVPWIKLANTKFKDFDKITANLGATVDFDLPPRMRSDAGLVANFQDAVQRVETLTVDQARNVSYEFTAQERIFNADRYMDIFGKSAIAELAAEVESNVALNCETAPYRFYGDGITDITNFGQLGTSLAQFRNYGAARDNVVGVLPDTAVPAITNSGLNQFAVDRNNEMANSWEIGTFSRCEWHESNFLPIHTAGSEGEAGSTLTVVSVTTNADGAVTAITFSGTAGASDADSVKAYDRFYFLDGVAGFNNMRFLTHIGHKPCDNSVQFMATADAASTGGSQVTVSINPPLQANIGQDQNINQQIQAGMQCKVLPTHRAGLIMAGKPLFLAMPMLPDTSPFASHSEVDPETGCSMRVYGGTKLGENLSGTVSDVIWGSRLVPEYSMALIFKV